MSKESLEQFVQQVTDDEQLQARIGDGIDAAIRENDGQTLIESLIALGAECGCNFSVEDLAQTVELSDEELDGVAGGTNSDANTQSSSNYDAVSYLPEMGIIKGYEDGTFQPESSTNRVKWLMARIRPSRIG